MKILIACEFSGIVRDAFAKLGHDAWSCDLLPTERPGNHYQGNVLDILNDGWDMIISHPPCTYLTVTGNKWMLPEYSERFPNRKQQRQNAIDFFMEFTKLSCEKIAIENPIGIMSTHYKKPDQIIQPYQFGHDVKKSTCLWLKGLPKLIPTNVVGFRIDVFKSGNRQSSWHTETGKIKDRTERSKERSKTFQGIADAMAEQWGNL